MSTESIEPTEPNEHNEHNEHTEHNEHNEHRLEGLLHAHIAEFVAGNGAARVLAESLDEAGVGLGPIIDHLTWRTLDVDARAREFVELGYVADERLEYDDWWARVYRRAGHPALFIDQAFAGERGRGSILPGWVARFGDRALHHVAVRVEDIDRAVAQLARRSVAFAGAIVGERGERLRQIFTAPELREGQPFTVLELTERHDGYLGFLPAQASGLMQSTVRK